MYQQLLIIAIGGAIGSVLRFVLAFNINQLLESRFPYGVLVVNALGCLLAGFLSVLLIERFDLSPLWRMGLMIGFLGGFTTMSTFSLDTFNLFEQGEYWLAAANIFFSLILCVPAAFLGAYIGRNML